VPVCAPLPVSVHLTHAGPTGDVVVTVFMEWLNASVPVPNLALVAFTKVYNMTDGESREIKLTVEPEQRVVITDETFIRTVEPRPIKLWVGNGQPEQQLQLQALEGEGESGDAGADRRGGVRKYLSGQSGVQQATVGMDGVATALKHC
jgi:hypothetical protein